LVVDKIDKNLAQQSLNRPQVDGKTAHGYSFEDFIILALGFTEEDGSPYRDHRLGGSAKHTQPFDVPQEVVERNPIIPEAYKLPWSIKAVEQGKSIGLGTARFQYDPWAKNGIVQATAFYYKDGDKKLLDQLSIKAITPSPSFWGNLSRDFIFQNDPAYTKARKNGTYNRTTFEQKIGEANRNRTGKIAIRALGRQGNLQAYMNYSDYYSLVA
jgi:hypothetical protein